MTGPRIPVWTDHPEQEQELERAQAKGVKAKIYPLVEIDLMGAKVVEGRAADHRDGGMFITLELANGDLLETFCPHFLG